jgi:hypothetical protein
MDFPFHVEMFYEPLGPTQGKQLAKHFPPRKMLQGHERLVSKIGILKHSMSYLVSQDTVLWRR